VGIREGRRAGADFSRAFLNHNAKKGRPNLLGITPVRVRRIRKTLDFSQEDFAHILWVTWTTVNRWETGAAEPHGIHLRILHLLERQLATRSFRASLGDPRAGDPMFLLYRLLKPLYPDDASTVARR